MKQYAIWNKKDNIIVPTGQIYSAKEWMEKYPVAKLDNITVLCGAGEINGSFFGTLGQMVHSYENEGADFSQCTTDEEKLAVIEAFDDAKRLEASSRISNEELTASALASIAASMEYQNMLTLPDEEV